MDVTTPDLGDGVSEAIVARWHRKAGDAVRAGEPLVDLYTEKTTTEVAAPASGVVAQVFIEEGAVVSVGTRMTVIRET